MKSTNLAASARSLLLSRPARPGGDLEEDLALTLEMLPWLAPKPPALVYSLRMRGYPLGCRMTSAFPEASEALASLNLYFF